MRLDLPQALDGGNIIAPEHGCLNMRHHLDQSKDAHVVSRSRVRTVLAGFVPDLFAAAHACSPAKYAEERRAAALGFGTAQPPPASCLSNGHGRVAKAPTNRGSAYRARFHPWRPRAPNRV